MAFSTPLICCSSGVMTVSAMVLGEAPGYVPLTTTVGGTISGYSLMGSDGMANRPPTAIRMASTDANIGRSMNTEEMFMSSLSLVRGRRRLLGGDGRIPLHRHLLRVHDDPGMHALRPVHDDHVTGLESLPHDAQAVDHAPQLYTPVLDLVAGPQQQHVLLALIRVDR